MQRSTLLIPITSALLFALAACQSVLKLGGGIDGASSPASAPSYSPSVDDGGEPVGDRAQAALELVPAVQKYCPNTDTPPPTEEQCDQAIDDIENAFARVGTDMEHPRVVEARRIVQAARDQRHVWAGHHQDQKRASYQNERDYKQSIRRFEEEFDILANGRENQASGLMRPSTFGNDATDSLYALEHNLARYEFDALASFARDCATHPPPTLDWHKDRADKCDLAVHRDRYYRQWVAAGVRGAILGRAENWTNAIERLESTGLMYRANYEILTSNDKLLEAVGARAENIIKATGVKLDPAALVEKELRPIRQRLARGLRQWSKKSLWAERAKNARHQDAGARTALNRNLGERGLSLVRYGLHDANWRIVYKGNRPVERTKVAQVMARARGESFCRIYQIAVVQEHMGGGRYGPAKVYTVGFDEFHVSSCK